MYSLGNFPSFIHQWLSSPLLGSGLFFSLVIFFTQTVGLIGQWISPSQGRYLHTEQHKHRINAHTDIHAFSGIGTHDPSVRASEDNLGNLTGNLFICGLFKVPFSSYTMYRKLDGWQIYG
jgi:hypothetical protein